ncbi:hypothetical protein [Streptomyces sp. D2-8]|uniref:hypothetical protein n=1 Tax=Streptomyces sp. D2-8 TaxID=2707767 RepID=UPI0020BDAFBA|nr:hypothetical protein [Streptomyces sp. D2-8]
MPTEFLHGLYDGGAGAGLDDYWKLMGHERLSAGGFLWSLVDEGIVRDDLDGTIDVAGNAAPDGILGPFREKEAGFYTIKDIWSPVQLAEQERFTYRPIPPDARADGNGYTVQAEYSGVLRHVRWRLHPSGWLQLDYRYDLTGEHHLFGVGFDHPESRVTGVTWLGHWPHRVWKNRLCGVATDVWTKQHNDTATGADGWVYPEFKGYHAGVRWASLHTTAGRITMVSEDENLYLRLFTPRFGPTLAIPRRLPEGRPVVPRRHPGRRHQVRRTVRARPQRRPHHGDGRLRSNPVLLVLPVAPPPPRRRRTMRAGPLPTGAAHRCSTSLSRGVRLLPRP